MRKMLLTALLGLLFCALVFMSVFFVLPMILQDKPPQKDQGGGSKITLIYPDHFAGWISQDDIDRSGIAAQYLNHPWSSLAIARVQYFQVDDPRSAGSKKVSLHELVTSNFLETRLKMKGVQIELGAYGLPWRAAHLDKDPPLDKDYSSKPEHERNDPFYEVSILYRDGAVTFGPVWIVNVTTGKIVPANDFARLFEHDPEIENSDLAFQQKLKTVVKTLSNHQLDSGLSLGSFLLQRFAARSEACKEAEALKLFGADNKFIQCSKNRIIGWTVDHLIHDDKGDEHLAYFQWIENDRLETARWHVRMSGDAEDLSISLTPRGFQAIALMREGERFCPGTNPAETEKFRLCRLVDEELSYRGKIGDRKTLLPYCPSPQEKASLCKKSVDDKTKIVFFPEGKEGSAKPYCSASEKTGEVPLEEALSEELCVLTVELELNDGCCDPGQRDCFPAFNQKLTCEPESDGVCCERSKKSGEFNKVTLRASTQGDALSKLQAALKATQSGKKAKVFVDDRKKLIDRLGVLWPESYDIEKDQWAEGSGPAQVLLTSNHPAKPMIRAFSAVLSEGNFIMAAQDLLDKEEGVSLEPSECAKVELAMRNALDKEDSHKDSDGDGVSDLKDNCILVPNPEQSKDFAIRKLKESKKDALGDACHCRWSPEDLTPSNDEGELIESYRIFKIEYLYRQGNETKSVGFHVVSEKIKAPKKAAKPKKKKRRRGKAKDTPEEAYYQHTIIPIGELSEWAYWSVNPRNLKGFQDEASTKIPVQK